MKMHELIQNAQNAQNARFQQALPECSAAGLARPTVRVRSPHVSKGSTPSPFCVLCEPCGLRFAAFAFAADPRRNVLSFHFTHWSLDAKNAKSSPKVPKDATAILRPECQGYGHLIA